MRSFRSRILVLVLGLVTVVLTATVIAVVVQARAEVGHQAALKLQSAAETAREVLKFRGNQLTSAVEVLISDFGFKEAVSSGDTPTLLSAIANHRSRMGADVLIVLDPEGHVVASTLEVLSTRTRSDLEELVTADTDRRLLRLYRLIDGRPYQLVVSPVLAPDQIGWAAMGVALDDRLATDMSRLLGVEVSFVAAAGHAAPVVASSLAAAHRSDLGDVAARAAATPFSVQSDTDELLTWTNPIRSANGSLTLVLQQSLAGAMHPYQQLRGSILAIGLAILAVASILAVLLARSATRPVEDLTRAAERLEAGDYDTTVPRASTTELSRLAGAFNAMRAAVGERERMILHQALHDPLTGLPTRARITDVLEGLVNVARSAGRPLAVCLIEIQQLQDIVGSFGHAAADEVICEMARRLTSSDGMSERVARIGTDKFLVVLEGVDGLHAHRRADHIGERLRSPFDYGAVSLQLETRIGVAVFPDDGERAADLLQRSDLALYRAQETGATVGTFVHGDDEVHRHRLAILGDLRRAIGADELELYYQPKVALPSGRVVGCEALVRWRHPQKGFIPPAQFVPHAERTGLIHMLTAWVLGTAFRQQSCWQAAGLNLDVSVNVSPADLSDPGFADSVAALLARTGANASRIVLELTESAAMKDLPNTLRVMERLRVLGVRFSIDDFGTGYSSLAHLRRLPVDEIKIDRSFVQELEAQRADDVIVRSTINLGHALNLKVVAEGVEVAASWEALHHLGCDLVQGYFVAKPMPQAEFTQWASDRMATPPSEPVRVRTSRSNARSIDAMPIDDQVSFDTAQFRAIGNFRRSD